MRQVAGGPPIVIVVDDDPDVLDSLTFAFAIDGFEVRAHDCAEDLLACDALPANGCLVLDYQLRKMNGLELLERIRQSGHDLPAVLITTPQAALSREAALIGVPIVEKPLLCDTLINKVRELLRARNPTVQDFDPS